MCPGRGLAEGDPRSRRDRELRVRVRSPGRSDALIGSSGEHDARVGGSIDTEGPAMPGMSSPQRSRKAAPDDAAAAAYLAAWQADLPAAGLHLDGAALGQPGGARRPRQGSPEARPARAAMPPSSRRRAATRSRSSRPRRQDRLPELVPAAPRAHGRVGLRLLPGHPGGHGLRPRLAPRARTSSSRPAATPTSRTSGSSPRPSGRSSSTPTTSTRPCPGPGSGT